MKPLDEQVADRKLERAQEREIEKAAKKAEKLAEKRENELVVRKLEKERKKAGRPKKALVQAKKKVKGRPPGDADAIREYKARLLASPKSRRVMDSILNAALDDDHKNQAAAWKLVIDRIMPLSYFEEAKNAGGRASVNITITGVGDTVIAEDSPLIDIPFADYEVTE